jgi:tetratricopeptide (TPR) repeat protein
MNRYQSNSGSNTGLLAASCAASLLLGVIVGYIMGTGGDLGSSASRAYAAPAAPPPTQATPATASGLVNEAELRRYQDILTRNPKDFATATIVGNLLYDAGRYAEAIPYYQQAFALDSKNANLSTDLGTALWYSGRPDEALAQYRKSLAADPKHAQTFFNMGIVRLEGKQDPMGAIEAWSDLLVKNPGYPEADKVKRLMAEAQQKVVALAPSRTR